jgi:hypothetical protein
MGKQEKRAGQRRDVGILLSLPPLAPPTPIVIGRWLESDDNRQCYEYFLTCRLRKRRSGAGLLARLILTHAGVRSLLSSDAGESLLILLWRRCFITQSRRRSHGRCRT